MNELEYGSGRTTAFPAHAYYRPGETSLHGLSRTMERTGKDVLQSIQLVQKAWKKGRTPNVSPQKERTAEGSSVSLVEYRIYKGNLFIFSGTGVLITMYSLPADYYHKELYDGKTRIRKVKRYKRMNCRNCEAS